jgi:hypothetical protein
VKFQKKLYVAINIHQNHQNLYILLLVDIAFNGPINIEYKYFINLLTSEIINCVLKFSLLR